MYYPCSENNGADQLRGHREADLRLCFRICGLLVFSRGGSYLNLQKIFCPFVLRQRYIFSRKGSNIISKISSALKVVFYKCAIDCDYIMKTCPCNIQRYFSEAKIENFIGKILDFCNILTQNIHRGYTLE